MKMSDLEKLVKENSTLWVAIDECFDTRRNEITLVVIEETTTGSTKYGKIYSVKDVDIFVKKIEKIYPDKGQEFIMKLEENCSNLKRTYEMIALKKRPDEVNDILKQFKLKPTNLPFTPPSSGSSGPGLNRGPKNGPSMN